MQALIWQGCAAAQVATTCNHWCVPTSRPPQPHPPTLADSGLTLDVASLMLRLPRTCPALQLQPLDAFAFFLTDSEQLAEGD